jgi:hypothetical protein
MRRWIIAGILSLVAGVVFGSCASGFFEAAQARRVAQQVGYGTTGHDIMALNRELNGDQGCNGAGILTGLVIWIGGTAIFGRPHKRKAAGGPPRETGRDIWPLTTAALAAAALVGIGFLVYAIRFSIVHGQETGGSSWTSGIELTSAQTTVRPDRVAQLSQDCRDPQAGRAKNRNAVVEFEGYIVGSSADAKASEEDIRHKASDHGYEFFQLWLKPSRDGDDASLVCDLDARQEAIVKSWRVGSRIRVKGLFSTCDGSATGLVFLRPCVAL